MKYFYIFVVLAIFVLSACDTENPGGKPNPNNPTPSLPLSPTEAVTTITQGTTPEAVVRATKQVLAQGGIMVGQENAPEIPAVAPAASWFVDPALAFNMAAEAKERATSGRFTVTQLGQMWADMGFPCAGTGTPGEQLMGFLRAWVNDAKANPNAAGNFTPLFIAEIAKQQEPAIDLSSGTASPDGLRLSLLEIELIMAAFDRSVQVVEPAQPIKAQGVPVGACDQIKKALGTVGSKIAQKGLSWSQGFLTDQSLQALGMTETEAKTFGATLGAVFKALNAAMKIVKLIQMYASTEVALTVEGATSVHKPHKDEARVLVPVIARTGIPDEAWEEYQQHSGGQAYQDAISCFSSLGMPLPSQLKDIADKVDKWTVSFDVIAGSPKHVVIPSDVNTFDASFAGHPFSMKLKRDGDASAKATLKVDVKEEPELATVLEGPLIKATIKVKAEVNTAEPPNPAVLLGVTSFLGTLSSLLDLSVGWIQTGLRPSNTVTFEVEYHDLPATIEASASIDMRFHYAHFRDEPAKYLHTVSGTWTATLKHETLTLTDGTVLDGYRGEGITNYRSATAEQIHYEPGEVCKNTFSEVVMDGINTGSIGPTFNQQGNYVPNGPNRFVLGLKDAASAPAEQETVTRTCPENTDTITLPLGSKIMVSAMDALNLMDENFIAGSTVPGLYLDFWQTQPDGSLARRFTSGKTVSIIIPGATSDMDVLSQNTIIKLKPIFTSQ